MQTTFFEDIAITNRIYCDSLGLPSDVYQRPLSDIEANGVPLSPAEVEIAVFMSAGISRKSAEMFVAVNHMPAPVAVMGPRKPSAQAIIEYARSPEQLAESERLTGASIQAFYDECRSRTTITPWVGD